MEDDEPIKSQQEADEIFNYLVKTTADTMKISTEQATKRVKALFDSGILEGGNPNSIVTQFKITKFLATQIN